MCAESLSMGKDTPTDCSVNATVKGKTYYFGNEEAKATFMKDPEGNLAKAQAITKASIRVRLSSDPDPVFSRLLSRKRANSRG